MLYDAISVPLDRYATLIAKSTQLEVRLKELSTHGIALISHKNASVGTRLEVIFEIPALGYFRRMTVTGIVQHSHMTDEGYYLGLRFEDLPEREEEWIDDFIDYKKRLHKLGQKRYKGI